MGILAGNRKLVIRYHLIRSRMPKSDLVFLYILVFCGWEKNIVWMSDERLEWSPHMKDFLHNSPQSYMKRAIQRTLDVLDPSNEMHPVKAVWLCSARIKTLLFCFSIIIFCFPAEFPIPLVRNLSHCLGFGGSEPPPCMTYERLPLVSNPSSQCTK